MNLWKFRREEKNSGGGFLVRGHETITEWIIITERAKKV